MNLVDYMIRLKVITQLNNNNMTIKELHDKISDRLDRMEVQMDKHIENHNEDIDKLFAFKNMLKGAFAFIAFATPTILYILYKTM